MYHELTVEQIRNRRFRRVAGLCVAVLAVMAIVLGVFAMEQGARQQAAAAVRQSILDAAAQCAAIEGAYPSTLKHLESEYGLRINHNDFAIAYDCFAGNVMPSVTVVPR